MYTDQYRLTNPLNAPFDGRLNGKVFSSCDQNNDEVDSTNCGEKDGGWWHVNCAGIEPNDSYEDNNLLFNGDWLIYTFVTGFWKTDHFVTFDIIYISVYLRHSRYSTTGLISG